MSAIRHFHALHVWDDPATSSVDMDIRQLIGEILRPFRRKGTSIFVIVSVLVVQISSRAGQGVQGPEPSPATTRVNFRRCDEKITQRTFTILLICYQI